MCSSDLEQNEKMKSNKDLRILYFEFQRVLLDFQLKSHERYLRKFVNLFKEIDKDTNGLLNEEEFIQLIEMMKIEGIRRKESSRLLQKVDPYNHQQISFSDCISLFSNEFPPKYKTKSILELFISQNEQKKVDNT